MTQVRSAGGARPPFATPVNNGKAKAAAQPDKKVTLPNVAKVLASRQAAAAAPARHGTQVTFGQQALQALENTGEFIGKAVLTGVEDVGEAVYSAARTLGNGVVDVAKGVEQAVAAGVHGVAAGIEDSATAVGHGVVHVENALGDVWGMATQGMSAATSLATTLGNDAQALVTNVGNAATDMGVGAKAVLSGVGSVASTAANYGTYVVKQAGKALNELT